MATTKDKQSRKWQLTINNPIEKGFTHDKIKAVLSELKPCVYWCIADEAGGQTNTYHTHMFIVGKSPIRFSRMKNLFPESHIESAYSSCEDNVSYIKKEGKWEKSEKGLTKIEGTFEEWGELPPEHRGEKPELSILYEMIKSGMSNYEIIESNQDYLFDTDKIERVRLILKQEEFKNTWRDVEVTYIYGKTGAGKTRNVMESYGYENVFRITDYLHPYDLYKGEDIVCLEEYNSSIKINDILSVIDGYPVKLACRYSDKIACFTKVYFLTNISLEKQYPNVQIEAPETWKAFLRRIKKVIHYKSETEIITYNSVDEYFNRFNTISPKHTPFDDVPFK